MASGRGDNRPECIIRAVEGSLRRLGTGTIDLPSQHRVGPAGPIEDVAGVMATMAAAGHEKGLRDEDKSPPPFDDPSSRWDRA